MIEHLDGIHETVTYKENSSLRLFVNTDCEDYPTLLQHRKAENESFCRLNGLLSQKSVISIPFSR